MNYLRFTTPLPPSVNDYLKKSVIYVKGKPRVHIYESSEAIAYKKHVKNIIKRALKENEWITPDKNTYIIADLYVYLSQKKRDADNLLKCLQDAIVEAGLVYDDCIIMPKIQNIFIEPNNPRIEVVLRESDKKGVFLNQTIYDTFVENNCSKCNRYSRNCSLLKASIENKIIPEIDVFKLICTEFKQRKSKK